MVINYFIFSQKIVFGKFRPCLFEEIFENNLSFVKFDCLLTFFYTNITELLINKRL